MITQDAWETGSGIGIISSLAQCAEQFSDRLPSNCQARTERVSPSPSGLNPFVPASNGDWMTMVGCPDDALGKQPSRACGARMNSRTRSFFWVALAVVACGPAISQTPLSGSTRDEAAHDPHSNRTASSARVEPAAPVASSASAQAAVGEGASAAATPATAPAAAEESEVDAMSARGVIRVELLDPGKAPRKKLRFTYHAKEVLKLKMRTEGSVEVEIQAKLVRQVIPTMEFGGTLETTSVDSDGSAHRVGSYSDARILPTPGVAPALEKHLAEMLQGFGGVKFHDVVSTRGESLEQEFDWRSISNPDLRKSFESMTQVMPQTPWPEEAVGVGARWRTRSVKSTQGLSVSVETEATLLSLSGKTVEVRVDVTGAGTPEHGIGAGPAASVISSDSKATGQQRVTLDPMRFESTSSSDTTTLTAAQDTRVKMRMLMKFDTTIQR